MHPYQAEVGHFTVLTVRAVEKMGAFLAWDQPRDLFLPLREQVGDLRVGEQVVVYIDLDYGQRPIASMRLEAFLNHQPSLLRVDQKVNLLIIDESELGFTAIIQGQHLGMLYRSEVFQPLGYASQVAGYVKKIRPDGKVDLILQPTGIKGSLDLGQQILEEVRRAGGFLALTEQSPPEAIYQLFGVSKKKFKIALGGIYKQQLVSLEPQGIRLRSTL